MADFQSIVIGAGVVGLAVARELALSGKSVLVLERHALIGSETSSRNSEVIHAGIYYPPGSLKARFCVEGRRMMYEFAERRSIPHRRCGKLILATQTEELEILARLRKRAEANGVEGLEDLDKEQVAVLAPGVRSEGALFSSVTGIIDSHQFMFGLQTEAENAGAVLVLRAPVERLMRRDGFFSMRVGGIHDAEISCDQLVISAGLDTAALLTRFENLELPLARPAFYAKGHYFRTAQPIRFTQLIYPAPVPGGLGTHATLALDGSVRFGPDVKWIDDVDYSFESDSSGFYESIRRWYPSIDKYDLVPDYTGIRPKIVGPGVADSDFALDDENIHGIPGLVVLQGIESPGLTSSMAIAQHVIGMLD